MNNENGIPPEARDWDSKEEGARKELVELGIETTEQNIEAVLVQQKIPHFPEGHEEIARSLDSPEALKKAMEGRSIKQVYHSEGTTVWDHTKLAIQEVDALGLDDKTTKDLKLIFLYHDLGKVEVWDNDENSRRTREYLEEGSLRQTFIGHDTAGEDKMREGLRNNGIDDEDLEIFITVIKNHSYNTTLRRIIEETPKEAAEIIQAFGQNDKERERVVELLIIVAKIDGKATQYIALEDDELKNYNREGKLSMSSDAIWQKYLEGKEG